MISMFTGYLVNHDRANRQSLMLRTELEKQCDEDDTHIQNQDFHIQSTEVENTERNSEFGSATGDQ